MGVQNDQSLLKSLKWSSEADINKEVNFKSWYGHNSAVIEIVDDVSSVLEKFDESKIFVKIM